MTFNDKNKSDTSRDFDKTPQTKLSMDFFLFIAKAKLDKVESFQDAVDVIFNRDGAKELKKFLNGLNEMPESFQKDNSN